MYLLSDTHLIKPSILRVTTKPQWLNLIIADAATVKVSQVPAAHQSLHKLNLPHVKLHWLRHNLNEVQLNPLLVKLNQTKPPLFQVN